MNFRTAILVALMSLVISGCQCTNKDIVEVEFMNQNDKLLNCRQLEYAILDTKAKLDLADKQARSIDIYSNTPLCIMNTDWAIQKSRKKAISRINYLTHLQKKRGCIPKTVNVTKSSPKKLVVDTITFEDVTAILTNKEKDEDEDQAKLVKIPLN